MYDFKFGLFLEWSLKCTIDSNANVRNNDVLWSSCFNFFSQKMCVPEDTEAVVRKCSEKHVFSKYLHPSGCNFI